MHPRAEDALPHLTAGVHSESGGPKRDQNYHFVIICSLLVAFAVFDTGNEKDAK